LGRRRLLGRHVDGGLTSGALDLMTAPQLVALEILLALWAGDFDISHK
jgi:hypothetical protein